MTQNFIELLSLPLRKRVAATQFEATKARVGGEVVALAADVQQAFYEAVAADQILAVRVQQKAVADASDTAIHELRRAGNITELELSTRSALNAQAMLDLSMARSDVVKARERLLLLLDLPSTSAADLKLPEQLASPPAEKRSDAELQTLALRQRLDLSAQLRDVNVLAASAGVAARFSWLEDARLTVDDEHQVEGYWVTGPGISVPIPLFDTGAAKSSIARGKLQQAMTRLEFSAARAKSETRIANAELSATIDRATYITQTMVPLREKILRETQSHYNAMSSSVFDLLNAKRDGLDSEIRSIEARRDCWVARVQMARAVGGSF